MRTTIGLRRLIHQPRQTTTRIQAQPPMHTLPRHPISAPDLSDRRTVTKNLEHRRIPLLHHTQLHQHNGDPLQLRNDQVVTSDEGSAPPDADPHVEHSYRSHCHPGTGTRPKSGTHQPEPTRKASTGTAQTKGWDADWIEEPITLCQVDDHPV